MIGTLIRLASSMETDDFDPLVEFYGQWTKELAERYLPIPGIPVSKYECWDYVPVLKVLAGQRFEMTVPFEAAFDPGDLLVR